MIKIIELGIKIRSHFDELNNYIDEIYNYFNGNNLKLSEEYIIYNLDNIEYTLKELDRDIELLEIEYNSKINKY